MRTHLTYMVMEPELKAAPRWDASMQRTEAITENFLLRVVDACAAMMEQLRLKTSAELIQFAVKSSLVAA